jgi:tetratricopeptide (TPR) repeat protein
MWASPRADHWRWVAPLLLVVLVLVAFVPALSAGLVNWDDDDLLLEQMAYRTLTAESLRWMFTTTISGHFHPLTWLSYTLDWWVWGREMFGYHLTSILLHAGSAVVFFFLVRRLIVLGARDADEQKPTSPDRVLILSAAAAAALFAVHPLRAESVAWLAERRDVLSGLFFLLSVLFYVRYAESGRSDGRHGGDRLLNYGGAVACCGLSLLAKASAVTLPVILLILDAYPLGRLRRGLGGGRWAAVVDKLPFVALCVPAGVIAYVAQRSEGAMYPLAEYSLQYRCAQALYGLTFYVVKTVWPANLGPLYQIPSGDELLGPLLWQGAVGSALLVGAALVFCRRVPAITATIVYYIVQVSPVLGFAQSGPQLVADRYSYLSCLGFAALAGAGLHRLAHALAARGQRDANRVLGLAGFAAVILLAHATFRQADVWLSSLTLWSRGVQVSPNSSIAHTNRGDALVQFQAPEAALHEYKVALSLNPKDVIAVRHLAKLLLMHGDNLRAAAFYEYAVALDSAFGPLYPDYATALERAGRAGTAIDVLRGRVATVPEDWACTAYLAHLLSTLPDDDLRNGAEAVQLALRVNSRPGGPDARSLLLLATALAEAGRFEEAVAAAEDALDMAKAADDRGRIREITWRLELFREKKPYRTSR